MHGLNVQKQTFFGIASELRKSRRLWYCVWGKAESYFIINLLGILRLFPIAVGGRSLSACRLTFSDIYARAQASEWMLSSILPEPPRKRDVDKNGLRKVQLKS